MKNPKSEARNPKQIGNPKSQASGWWAWGIWDSEVKSRTRPLTGCRSAGFESAVSRIPNLQTVPADRGPRSSGALLARTTICRLALALGLLSSVFCLPSSVLCPQASAQYALTWWTVDGGGGTSTGGVYTVTGTIGQPDAGPPAQGGGYSVVGGFWSIVAAVQMPGAPYLSVWRTATNTVVVSWPLVGAEGWVLEATNALPSLAGPWPAIPPPYQTNGPNLQFIEPAPLGHKFYRLHKP